MNRNESTTGPDWRYWTRGFRDKTDTSLVQHYLAFFVAIAYLTTVRVLVSCASLLSRKTKELPMAKSELIVFAIGPFFSENWSMAHMEALCRADAVKCVYLFTPAPYKDIAKLRYVSHSRRLSAWFGDGIARVIGAWRLARKHRPDLVIGYHLPWNGLMALVTAKLANSKAAYFSVGGPPEIIGGGIYSEHALFARLARESEYIQGLFIKLLRKFDAILTMGTRSQDFFHSLQIDTQAIPIAVGINDARFSEREPASIASAEFDLVSVGRLSAIKQTDILLQIVAELEQNGIVVQAAIVGDGDQLEYLQTLARELGIADRIRFIGWVDNVQEILQRSKLFVMTSASEGLPHSLIEAMLTGMPVIVPDVGEIGDLVEDGLSGYLIRDNSTQDFAAKAEEMLSDSATMQRFGTAARRAALKYTVGERVVVWNDALDRIITNSQDT